MAVEEIPEYIHTYAQRAFWNSQGKGKGRSSMYIWKSKCNWVVLMTGIPKPWGFQVWDFQRGQTKV